MASSNLCLQNFNQRSFKHSNLKDTGHGHRGKSYCSFSSIHAVFTRESRLVVDWRFAWMCVIAITRPLLACPNDYRFENDMHDVMLIRREADCLGGERVADSGHTDTPPMHGPFTHVSSRQSQPHLFTFRVAHQPSSTYTTPINRHLGTFEKHSSPY